MAESGLLPAPVVNERGRGCVVAGSQGRARCRFDQEQAILIVEDDRVDR
jgi:hypothetical protein